MQGLIIHRLIVGIDDKISLRECIQILFNSVCSILYYDDRNRTENCPKLYANVIHVKKSWNHFLNIYLYFSKEYDMQRLISFFLFFWIFECTTIFLFKPFNNPRENRKMWIRSIYYNLCDPEAIIKSFIILTYWINCIFLLQLLLLEALKGNRCDYVRVLLDQDVDIKKLNFAELYDQVSWCYFYTYIWF